MKKSRVKESLNQIQEWIDINTEIFNDIKDEFEDYNVIQLANDLKRRNFTCNHCGECCFCEDFWIYCYATDINKWIRGGDLINSLILCCLFPMIDENDNIGYGFPSQKVFDEKIEEFSKDYKTSDVVKKKYFEISKTLKKLNPTFNQNSNYCIFYNCEKENHCTIYDKRPNSCKTYPYDNIAFTDIKIPTELSKKYEIIIDKNSEDLKCHQDCFNSKEINKKEPDSNYVENVLIDKINYLSSTIIEKEMDLDITDLLLEVFFSKINLLKKKYEK